MSTLEALLMALSYGVDALRAYALVCALVGAIALIYHAPGAYRRHRVRRSPWQTALKHGVRRAA